LADLGEPYHRGVTDGFDATALDLSSISPPRVGSPH